MLTPTEGACHGCYILAYCAGLDEPPSLSELLERARRLPSGNSFFQNLPELAAQLLDLGIMREVTGKIEFIPEFPACRTGADRTTKLQIAKVLLGHSRPSWLPNMEDAGAVVSALLPAPVETALDWMERDLVHVIGSVISRDGGSLVREAFGQIGEHFVMAAERSAGHDVRHVSPISDTYGYDLESHRAGHLTYIEVKCTVETKAGQFFLSRNEYEVSRALCDSWMLVQVVLRGEILFRDRVLDVSAIHAVNWLQSQTVSGEIVADRPNCQWREAVEFNIAADLWRQYDLRPQHWSMQNPLLSRRSPLTRHVVSEAAP
jgi:hypothetical protein